MLGDDLKSVLRRRLDGLDQGLMNSVRDGPAVLF
jgi:hypothetical protein